MSYILEKYLIPAKTPDREPRYKYVIHEEGSLIPISNRTSHRDYVAAVIDGSYYFGRLDLVGKGDHGRHLKWCKLKGIEPKPVAYLKQETS